MFPNNLWLSTLSWEFIGKQLQNQSLIWRIVALSLRLCRWRGWGCNGLGGGRADAAVCAGGAASGQAAPRAALVVLSLVLAAPHWPGAAHVSLYIPPLFPLHCHALCFARHAFTLCFLCASFIFIFTNWAICKFTFELYSYLSRDHQSVHNLQTHSRFHNL